MKAIILIVKNSCYSKIEHTNCVQSSQISLHRITINFVHVKYYMWAFNRLAVSVGFIWFFFLFCSSISKCDVSSTKISLMFCSIYKIFCWLSMFLLLSIEKVSSSSNSQKNNIIYWLSYLVYLMCLLLFPCTSCKSSS